MNTIDCLSCNKTNEQYNITKTFSILEYHYFECVSDEIIEANEFIGRLISYHFKMKKNNAMPIKFLQTLVYTSSLSILENKM